MMSLRSNTTSQMALPWVIRLRFLMALWQILRILAAQWIFHVEVPSRWIFIPPGIMILSNLWLSRRLKNKVPLFHTPMSSVIAGMFFADTLCITASLMLAGGAENPYDVLYLIEIVLSPMLLNRRQSWLLGAMTCFCFALVFRFFHPVPELQFGLRRGHDLYLIGRWFSFTVAVILLTAFSGKISALLDDHQKSMLDAREEIARKERLASLVTLAAGAAHELSTPLATIAVVARELERYATQTVPDTTISLDSHLIRTEVERCRLILQRMSLNGAEPTGEALVALDVGTLMSGARDAFLPDDRPRIRVRTSCEAIVLKVPRHALQQAFVALIRNAIQ